ncbi:BgTH12-00627 [Blumeria graminis f. sp. triticale]|uniref:BgTH12-00627 n=1 Tax=Blumeria graminis f. sp. triticale TaxID=1689686 RepID=A0A9W4GH08_BLUGR|nr:BgTH12-00627 [Blumeria graminis f. sp. triticale]
MTQPTPQTGRLLYS